MNSKIRVRFAPSPTGPLHIGGVRTALYNYLFAKQNGGDFILRIEDTDSSRFVQGAEEYIEEAFSWLGLHFDESPSVGGQFGPYRQSERKDIYRKYVDYLLENDKAYIAFDTPEELDAKRNEIPNFQYDAQTRSVMRNSLTLDGATTQKLIEAGAQYVVRIKIDADIDIKVNDLIRGEVVINSSVLDDKVIYKSADELPTYHLANVVDDHLMKITHVIRGEEWLPSAPLHVWLYRSLQWEDTMPQFAHLPLLLKPDGNGKLSKRDGDRLGFPVFPLEWKDPVSGEISSGYRESGYLPQAVINMLALLGWNPGTEQEVFSLKELVDIFSFARCSKSGAKFDAEKAKWFNHHYIQCLPIEKLADSVMPVLKEKGIVAENDKIETILQLIKERMNFIDDFWNQASFFFVSPESYAEKTVKKFWKNDTASQIESLRQLLQQTTDFSSANLEQMIKEWITNNNFKMGNIMNALRLSIVGESKGPHLFDILHLIGKDESIHRINMAIKNLHPTS